MEIWLENEILKAENRRLRAQVRSMRPRAMMPVLSMRELLAQAAYEHPGEVWAVRAQELICDWAVNNPLLCPGYFNNPPQCDDMHAHGLKCGNPSDVCKRCGKTNADHRKEQGIA